METEVHCLKKDMLLINYEAPDGSRHHNRLWNGGNGWGTIKLYDRQNGQLILIDEIEATHIGCEYGEYDHEKPYSGDGEFDYRLTDTEKETSHTDYFALRKALYRTLESTISLHGKHQRATRKALAI